MLNFSEYPLIHYNQRPAAVLIDTLIIHSMYDPDCTDPINPQSCFQLLDKNRVSAHYSITYSGDLVRHVAEQARAWHAGVSRMPFGDDQRENVNDFSIGVELVALPTSAFSPAQYEKLVDLILDLASRHPLKAILGHEHIAPERKSDPGPFFDWDRLIAALAPHGKSFRYPPK